MKKQLLEERKIGREVGAVELFTTQSQLLTTQTIIGNLLNTLWEMKGESAGNLSIFSFSHNISNTEIIS